MIPFFCQHAVFSKNEPARAAFQVAALPKVSTPLYQFKRFIKDHHAQGAKVEIEAVAIVGKIVDE